MDRFVITKPRLVLVVSQMRPQVFLKDLVLAISY